MSLSRFVAFRLTPFLLMLCLCVALGWLLAEPGSGQAENGQEGEDGNSIVLKTAHYAVNAYWPGVGIARVDEESRAHVRGLVKDFLTEIEETIAEMQSLDEEEAAYLYRTPRELSVTYELTDSLPRTVSILWNVYSYTGGAHGMLDMTTNNYDRETGYHLLLDDLFLDPQLAMVQFAREARNTLAEPDEDGRTIPDDMLRAGTEPEEDNYRTFVITPTGIRLHFPPYQVAPWAVGPRQVDVSLEALAPAKPNLEYWAR